MADKLGGRKTNRRHRSPNLTIDYESFSLTDEYLLRGLVSIILDSGMAIWGPPAPPAAAAEAPPPCLELGRPSAAAGVCGRFRETTAGCLGGGVVGGLPEVAAAASDQAASIMAAAEASEVAVEGAAAAREAALLGSAAIEVAEVAVAEGAAAAEGMPPPPWCPATGMAKAQDLGSDTCAPRLSHPRCGNSENGAKSLEWTLKHSFHVRLSLSRFFS